MASREEYLESELRAERAYHELDKRMALVEQTLTVIKDNHLAHLSKDVEWIKKVMWLTAAGVIGNLLTVLFIIAFK